jgi:hypothetical protein
MTTIVHMNPYGESGKTWTLSTSSSVPFQLLPETMGQFGPEFLFRLGSHGLELSQNKKVNKDGLVLSNDGTLTTLNLAELVTDSGRNEWDKDASMTEWAFGKTYFIGLSSNPNADFLKDTSYTGWARVKVNSEKSLTVYDWAYTTEPCRPIEAGQVPEAQSPVIFALCVLILAFRRFRSWF